MRTLWASVVGSHAWNMQRPDSDIDIIEVVIDGARDFFTGNGMTKNVEIHETSGKELGYDVKRLMDVIGNKGGRVDKYDVTQMEIGHLIDLLKKGNINAIWAVMSPVQSTTTGIKIMVLDPLKKIVLDTLSFKTWKSVKGCVYGGNMGKKREHGLLVCDGEKKPKSAKRILEQFNTMLNTGEITFPTIKNVPAMAELNEMIARIDARIDSGEHVLKTEIDTGAFDQFLFELRRAEYASGACE